MFLLLLSVSDAGHRLIPLSRISKLVCLKGNPKLTAQGDRVNPGYEFLRTRPVRHDKIAQSRIVAKAIIGSRGRNLQLQSEERNPS